MEFLLGFAIVAFVAVVTTDTFQKRRQDRNKNR
jgi:hypothetical protein